MKLNKEDVEKARHDLIEIGFIKVIDEIVNEKKSLYWVNNFPYLFDTPLGWYRKIDSELANAVDEIVKNTNFDLAQYHNLKYYSTSEAHERAFPIYKKLHDEKNFSFKRLFG